jgi:hypothetical protein
METASANQAVKIDVKRQSKGPLSYAYNSSRSRPSGLSMKAFCMTVSGAM